MPAEQDSHREAPTRHELRQEASFDALARGLASGTISRRRALRLLGAALAGAMMASIPGVAWAKPCKAGNSQCGTKCCPPHATCQRGECVFPTCPTGVVLPPDRGCIGGPPDAQTCQCPPGYICAHGSGGADCGAELPCGSVCCQEGTFPCVTVDENGQVAFTGTCCPEGKCTANPGACLE
jgi:hypothetical protein